MKKKKIIILACVFCLFSLNIYAKSVSELNQEKSEIQDQVEQSKEELEKTQEEKSALLTEVEKLDMELNSMVSELEALENELNLTIENLEKSEEELRIAEETKNNQYETLKQRLRVMYENGNSSYLEILLDSKNVMDFFKKVEYVERIIAYDQEIFEKYEETEALCEAKVEEIKIQKENIEILAEEANYKKEQLEQSIANKEAMLKELEQNEEYLEQQIADLEEQSKKITDLINQANVSATGSSSNKIYNLSGGQLAYPVPAYTGWPVNSPYGYRQSPIFGKMEFHTGVDLKATYGTDIVSAEAGTVIYASWMNGFGNTVIVDHGGGMTTLYGHNSSLTVSVGQSVARGQVIAKAGSTGYSTGVHLHFEVRINGQHTDPAPYLQ